MVEGMRVQSVDTLEFVYGHVRRIIEGVLSPALWREITLLCLQLLYQIPLAAPKQHTFHGFAQHREQTY
ncbi:hypothetical protein EVAR_24504_1 [Eumeta japonica]|uniref:Uncharacterized protein n=1 Tax=Eumeta variegata TaxID=151549 RepID=A0A4C1UR89_EUMVA|nr:hypothetical protein EVAR_24504_1 [Eumeta japonica]